MKPASFLFAGAAFALLGACDSGPANSAADAAPEAGQENAADRNSQAREAGGASGGMVAAAHPLAVEAGLDALRASGDAVDAAIAVQMVLGLVEPQSSGIGGGAFMVRYDAETGETTVYDGRETAPSAADETLFLDEDGEPLGFIEAWQSGRSTGAPGAIAMLALAHERHGELDWAAGFEHGVRLAEEGFALSGRTSELAGGVAEIARLDEDPIASAYFYDENGDPWPEGHEMTNPAYAQTLRSTAEDWRNFYTGEIADGIVEALSAEPLPGLLTAEDIAAYEPVVREAVCSDYRDYQICSAPPPSSGAVAVGAILGILESFDMASMGPDTVQGWHLFIEASRLAYADRDRYVGDPAFADVPVEGMLDKAYLAERAALIDMDAAIGEVEAGAPPGAPQAGEDDSDDAPGTSHISIVDGQGNVVSMTTTVESAFGSNRMTKGGFLLNNQLTDFARDPRDAQGDLRANAPAAGKRPRSSMSPTIVLDGDGAFVLATGSPGGNSIVAYTAKSLVAMLDWGLNPQEAAALPNVVARGDQVSIETGFNREILQSLESMGHDVLGERGENSGIHIIRKGADGELIGGADPRRDGAAERP